MISGSGAAAINRRVKVLCRKGPERPSGHRGDSQGDRIGAEFIDGGDRAMALYEAPRCRAVRDDDIDAPPTVRFNMPSVYVTVGSTESCVGWLAIYR